MVVVMIVVMNVPVHLGFVQPSDFLLMIGELAAALSDPELKQLAGARSDFQRWGGPTGVQS